MMVYDVIMFIQMFDQERMALLPEDSSQDSDEEAIIRDEIEEAPEKLQAYFYEKDAARVDIFEDLLKRETGLIKHRYGVEFLIPFIDFFDFYETDVESTSTFANIHLIYENFYHVLNRIRFDMPFEEQNGHKLVLDTLEMCLRFTDHQQTEKVNEQVDKICDLSHRKYAEMYFFYKFYLLRTDRGVL
jgi:hypothetical protein